MTMEKDANQIPGTIVCMVEHAGRTIIATAEGRLYELTLPPLNMAGKTEIKPLSFDWPEE